MVMVVPLQSWLRGILAALKRDEIGQDMIEYALLVTLITIPLILAIMATGPFIQNTFQDVANALAQTPG
jgi:Flp pilus assembly pilin Flp